MSRSMYTGAQMIAALKQVEAGRTVDEMAWECRVGRHTIYAWKTKYVRYSGVSTKSPTAAEDCKWSFSLSY